MRTPLALSFLFLFCMSLSHADITNITYSPNATCPSWTQFVQEKALDVRLNDMGYVRDCKNIQYISFCNERPTFVNENHTRRYSDILCPEADFCRDWTRFYPETIRNITQRQDNLTRTCVNTTYVSWCIKDHSNIDYRTGKRYSELQCGDWTQGCQLKFISSAPKIDQAQSQCRSCNQSTYRMICTFGGRTTNGATSVQSDCGEWMDCALLQPGINRYSTNFSSDTSASSPIGIDSSSLLVALLMGVGLTVVLVLVFSGHQE